MLRCRPHRIGVTALGVFLSLLVSACRADEAWRGDGERLRGHLTLEGDRLRFQTTEGAAIPPDTLTRIRFPQGKPTPCRIGAGRRILLWDGEQITGQILDLDKDKLRVRTAWAERVEIPRAAVSSIDALPGWRTILHDDGKAFAAQGKPEWKKIEEETTALVLNADGQAISYTLKEPLSAGRFGVNFREQAPTRGGRWTVDLLFRHGERSRHVAFGLSGNGENYDVDVEGLKGTARQVKQSPGWHRSIVQFSARSLRWTCDDEVLWYNLDEGPGGFLEKVTVRCRRAEGGATAWTEFCLERAVDEHPKPPTEPEQDEVRSLDDDQWFGRILQADRRTLEIEGRFGKRSFPWTTLSGCSFLRPAAPPKGNVKASVRLSLDSGLCAEPDLLDGVLVALDDRKMVLRHAFLGELTFERSRVRELRPQRVGQK